MLTGEDIGRFAVVNEFLGYLADRNYSPRTRRFYAFDLLHFTRWLDGAGVSLGEVTTDTLLRFLTGCREASVPGRPGGNVFSIVDGRDAGYAPATINRRLAAVSGLFGFRQLCDPDAVNPVPRGREARAAARGERTGLLAHVHTRPKNRSRLRVREPRRLPQGLDRAEATALLGVCGPGGTARSPGGCSTPGCARRRCSAWPCATSTFDDAGCGSWARATRNAGSRLTLRSLGRSRPTCWSSGRRRKSTRCRGGQGVDPGPAVDPGRVAHRVPLPPRADRRGGRAPARAATLVWHRAVSTPGCRCSR